MTIRPKGETGVIGDFAFYISPTDLSGIKTVIIPEKNVPDLDEIDDEVKSNIRFVPVRTIDEVLTTAFVSMPEPLDAGFDEQDDSPADSSADQDQTETLQLRSKTPVTGTILS